MAARQDSVTSNMLHHVFSMLTFFIRFTTQLGSYSTVLIRLRGTYSRPNPLRNILKMEVPGIMHVMFVFHTTGSCNQVQKNLMLNQYGGLVPLE